MADETKRVDVLMGPYRGNLLTMPTADADAAINAHWARDPFSGEPYGEHGALTEQERTDALAAANTWAQAQWEHAGAPPPEPPVGGETRRRAVSAEENPGYKTRGR